MPSSLWLNLRRGAPGLDGPFLEEMSGPFQRLDQGPDKEVDMITIIRGPQTRELPGHVHMFHSDSSVILDCSLHLQASMPVIKAGWTPPNIIRHPVQRAQSLTGPEIARRFYSRALLSLNNACIFVEAEYGGIAEILAELASWVYPDPPVLRQKPVILILTEREGSMRISSKDLEWTFTTEVLARCNVLREHSFKTAENAWRDCFSGLMVQEKPTEGQTAVDFSTGVYVNAGFHRAFTRSQVRTLLQVTCIHFAEATTDTLSLVRASRATQPVPELLSTHIAELVKRSSQDPALAESTYHFIASVLVSDAFRSKIWLPPEPIFTEIYRSLIENIEDQSRAPRLTAILQDHFVRLASQIVASQGYTRKHMEIISLHDLKYSIVWARTLRFIHMFILWGAKRRGLSPSTT
ncbi:hypothetical protein PG985_014782 [Apiospora marii]|uniref:uncharacterized protein n=1 Tax=Apiospora marii TaxID=335849 RepID=UPI003131DA09